MLLVIVLNKTDLNSKTTILEDTNHFSMPTIPNLKIMKVLFHSSLRHCLYDEGRQNVIIDCSGLNYAHVWIDIITILSKHNDDAEDYA